MDTAGLDLRMAGIMLLLVCNSFAPSPHTFLPIVSLQLSTIHHIYIQFHFLSADLVVSYRVSIGLLTKEFLDFSASRGNNLRQVPGLDAGCKWCLCTARWKEAMEAAKGPDDPVVPKYVFPPLFPFSSHHFADDG